MRGQPSHVGNRMIGTARIFAALRLRRLLIAMLFAPLFTLNLVAADLGIIHPAQARSFDEVVAQSRCLTDPAPVVPGEAPAKSNKQLPCPTCATACATGCCVGSALLGSAMPMGARRIGTGLDTAHLNHSQWAAPAQFQSSQRAQAPPQLQASQSLVA